MKRQIRTSLQRIKSQLLGMIDYYRYPETRQSWGGPLNGQQKRQEIIISLFDALKINNVVETGGFRGTTTELFSALCPGKVFSIEANDRYYGYTKMRFLFSRNVVLFRGDSRVVLSSLITNTQLNDKYIFFYLDAHWAEDLPLAEEIDIVFSQRSKSAVVMIDDFQIPDDTGYAYDDYGQNKALTLDYIQAARDKFGLRVFFPTAHSSEETGEKRGSVVLVADSKIADKISSLSELRRYQN